MATLPVIFLIIKKGSGILRLQEKLHFDPPYRITEIVSEYQKMLKKDEFLQIKIGGRKINFEKYSSSDSAYLLRTIKAYIKKNIPTQYEKLEHSTQSPNIKKARFEVRISEEEKIKIENRAKEANMKTSRFARTMLLEGSVIVLTPEEKRNITGIGNNFNQLLRRVNSGMVPQDVVEDLRQLLKDLKKHYRN